MQTKEIQLWLKHVAREVSVSISPKSIQPLPDDMKHKRKAAMNHSCGISFASSEVLEQGSTRAVRFGYPATQLSWTAPTTGLPVQLPYLTHRSEGNGMKSRALLCIIMHQWYIDVYLSKCELI